MLVVIVASSGRMRDIKGKICKINKQGKMTKKKMSGVCGRDHIESAKVEKGKKRKKKGDRSSDVEDRLIQLPTSDLTHTHTHKHTHTPAAATLT